MPFKEGDRTILGRERIYSDYNGNDRIPHAESYVDIEPMGSKTLRISGGRNPNEPAQSVILYELSSIVINGKKIEWQEEDTEQTLIGSSSESRKVKARKALPADQDPRLA